MEIKFVLLIALVVVSVVYLTTLFFKFSLLQAILKGCLLPLILAVYIFGAQNILLPFVLALVFGWIGDVFLLKITDPRCFKIGLCGFLIGHICFIIAMFKFALPLDILPLIISVVVCIALSILILRAIKVEKELQIPIIVYDVVIMTMAIFALQLFITQDSLFGTLIFIGSISFIISDFTLAFDTFKKKTTIGYFCVMVTYIAAQLLLTLGLSGI
jgi:uncharacterized membrane protein YhhN